MNPQHEHIIVHIFSLPCAQEFTLDRQRHLQRLAVEFNSLRISKLIVQWNVLGDPAFYLSESFSHGPNPPLETVLALADESGIEVHIGLWHDPDFWKNIAVSPGLLEVYLRRAHLRSATIAGVGMTSGHKSVRWIVAARILWARILTIPVSGLIAGLFFLAYEAVF